MIQIGETKKVRGLVKDRPESHHLVIAVPPKGRRQDIFFERNVFVSPGPCLRRPLVGPDTLHRRGPSVAIDSTELSAVATHHNVHANVVPRIGPISRWVVKLKVGVVVEPVEDIVDEFAHGLPADFATIGVGVVVLIVRQVDGRGDDALKVESSL